MKRILNTNKGFTLIEVIVSISIFLILTSLVLKQFIINIFNFKNELDIYKEDIYSISAMDTLGELISEADSNTLNINSNIITYMYKGEKREITIEKNISYENDLVINYYNVFGSKVTKKYINKNLNYFSVNRKNKVIYINFENNKGSIYNKCLVKE